MAFAATEAHEIEEAYERINVLEDLLGCALSYFDGALDEGSRDGVVGDIRAYFEERKNRKVLLR